MSISPNGAPLGTQGIIDLADTPSWRSPTEYVDPLTGKTWRADTLHDLLALLEENDVRLFDKAEMDRLGKTLKKGKPPEFDPSGQWERLLIRLDHYPDPEKARTIILNVLANPNVTITESKGKGRVREFDFKGRRAVIAHEVHHNDERGPHFMAQVHVSGVDAHGNVLPRATFKSSEHQSAMVAQINEALASNGLAPLVFSARGADYGTTVAEQKAQLTPKQAEEYREAAEKGELPPLQEEEQALADAEAMPASSRKEMLRQAAQQAGAEAASLFAQAAQRQKQNAMYRTALRALENEEQHLARIGTLTAKLQEATANAEQAEAQHAATVAEQAAVIEQTQIRATELAEQLETTAGQLSETARSA